MPPSFPFGSIRMKTAFASSAPPTAPTRELGGVPTQAGGCGGLLMVEMLHAVSLGAQSGMRTAVPWTRSQGTSVGALCHPDPHHSVCWGAPPAWTPPPHHHLPRAGPALQPGHVHHRWCGWGSVGRRPPAHHRGLRQAPAAAGAEAHHAAPAAGDRGGDAGTHMGMDPAAPSMVPSHPSLPRSWWSR